MDNGDAATTDSFHADHRKAFSGLALAIVRAGARPGKIRVEATSEGLAPATVELTVRK